MPTVGQTWRQGFVWVKLDARERGTVSFSFGPGFGCEQTAKVNQGQKFTLQTLRKFTTQLGGKLAASGAELSSGLSSEFSETVIHEFAAGFEWSYTAKPCQYCNPRIKFTSATISVYLQRPLNLPLFVSRRTVFDPGPDCQIEAHCRNNAEECGDCSGASVAAGNAPVMKAESGAAGTHLERVVLDSRAGRKGALQDMTNALLADPETGLPARQLYLVDLRNRVVPVRGREEAMSLYSVDDLDRALGAIRLHEGVNELLVVSQASAAAPAQISATLEGLAGEPLTPAGQQQESVQVRDMRMTSLVVTAPSAPPGQYATQEPPRAVLRMRQGEVEEVWPAVVVPR